jgi:hypothetical protein
MNQPIKNDWAALYQTAIMFKETAPWNWMDSDELFAVENPHNGEVGYCSILGSGGEELGLGIFIGEDGYNRYIRVIEGKSELLDNIEESIMVRSLSMLLVDRDMLHKKDREVIHLLGLRFRGRNAWPLFRSQYPGYLPWFLEKEEAIFLTTAIQQALVVANEVRNGKLNLLEGAIENLVLTRYYHGSKWDKEWRRAPVSSQGQETHVENVEPVKEAELYLLHDHINKYGGVWELDIFVLPVPIGSTSGRPYYPICFLVVENELGLILGTNLAKPWLTFSEKQDEVIQIIRKANQLPHEIRVKSDKMRRILEPITSILGIKLRVTSLPMMEQAKASLYERFSG